MKRQRIFAFVKIQFKSLIKVPTALFIVLILPVALILIFGAAFGGVWVEDYGWTGQDGTIFEFLVPGFLALSGLFMAIPVALSFSEDREQGLLKRINTTPTTASEFMASHIISNMCMAIIQVAIIFLLTFIMRGMRNITPEGVILSFVIMVIFSLSTIGFGLITATVAKSAKAAGGIVWIFLLPQQMLAANLYPLPPETRFVSMFMPLHYASDALTLLFSGVDLTNLRIWADLGILILFSVALVFAGIILFRKYGKA
ncbi:MAG: ABC transporter permease [Promethearchaeota archaeon]|jgi:ABC-type multidrug transport system permease subunit